MIIRRIGLVLAGVIALLALVPALEIRPEVDTGQVGVLSVVVLVVTAAVAVVTIAFMVPAWLGGRAASITIAVAQLAGILTSLPAFFAPAELVSTGAVACRSGCCAAGRRVRDDRVRRLHRPSAHRRRHRDRGRVCRWSVSRHRPAPAVS